MNTVTVQREQARTQAVQAAEWANETANACEWFIAQLDSLPMGNDPARRIIAEELRRELSKWRAVSRSNAETFTERAETITATLCAAARVASSS